MPRKPGPGRTEYNNAWNAAHPAEAKAHRQKANLKFWGKPGTAKRERYNAIKAAERREARARKKKAKAVAARLLAEATTRAQFAIRGYAGIPKPNHF